jgi:hypothetical protein
MVDGHRPGEGSGVAHQRAHRGRWPAVQDLAQGVADRDVVEQRRELAGDDHQ